MRNLHRWAIENPRTIRSSDFQSELSVNALTGLIDNLVTDPYILPARLSRVCYKRITTAVEVGAVNIRKHISIQRDTAPAHFGIEVRYFLNNNYVQYIDRETLIAWPPRFPDHNPLEFYF